MARILRFLARLRRSRFRPKRYAGKACGLALRATAGLWLLTPVVEPSRSFAAADENASGIQMSVVSELSLSCAAEGDIVLSGFVPHLAAALSVVPSAGEVREVTCIVGASNPSGFVLSWKQVEGGSNDRWVGRVTANASGRAARYRKGKFLRHGHRGPFGRQCRAVPELGPRRTGVERIQLGLHPVSADARPVPHSLGISFTATPG